MRVHIQRFRDGFFLNADGGWTPQKEAAKNFVNCTPAINHCVEQKLGDVRLWLSFDDPKYDFPMEVFRAETRMLVQYSKELREKGRALLAAMDQERAAAKEKRRQFEFPFKRAAEEERPKMDTDQHR